MNTIHNSEKDLNKSNSSELSEKTKNAIEAYKKLAYDMATKGVN